MKLKLKELLEALNTIKQELGEDWETTDVRVYADHGQYDMLVNSTGIMYSGENPDEYMIEGASNSPQEYFEDYEEIPTYKFVSISGM